MKKNYMILMMTVVLFSFLPLAQAQEYGKIRALQDRAVHVTKQKNDFIVRVLRSYKIPHQVNEQGFVVRIYTDGKWLDIKSIEIIPVLKESPDQSRRVAAHELYFFTTGGILNVMSALTIK